MTFTESAQKAESRDPYLRGLARGIAGALLFSLPMLMTMEMWHLGFTIPRGRLLLLLVINLPLLVALSHRIGFERTATWGESARDAIVAFAIGILASAFILIILGIMTPDMPARQWVSMVGIQAVPASIGALLGRSQLSMSDGDDDTEAGESLSADTDTRYSTELFMMAVGALFLSLNLAPTEEVVLIAYKLSHWHALALVAVSLIIMHAFVYAVAFRGSHDAGASGGGWTAFLHFTLPGYVVALLVSLYTMWTLQRLEGLDGMEILLGVIVLGFPGAIGAAAARLIL